MNNSREVVRVGRERWFPQEVVSDVPRVTATGNETVLVEQHKGLMAYQPEEVVFRTASGLLTIRGSGLRFKHYTAGEALVTGCIEGISMTGRGAERT